MPDSPRPDGSRLQEPSTILVFPCGMQAALEYLDQARRNGFRVVGASSIEVDGPRHRYDAIEHLPFVTDKDFIPALNDLIAKHHVSRIYTPHHVIWANLNQWRKDLPAQIELDVCRVPRDEDQIYRNLETAAAGLISPSLQNASAAPLTDLQRAGLLRLIHTIPGMCGDEKAVACMEVMRAAPVGDIVEIGSWWGRSAALLNWLAQYYGIGRLLCIDPWHSSQTDQGNDLLDEVVKKLDFEYALQVFKLNLAPLSQGNLNFIQGRSEDVHVRYKAGLVVQSDAFGTTVYTGEISVLHIDGNHSFEQASLDIALWTQHLVPGGWVIFDDYEWGFGDGVKLAADLFLQENYSRIIERFQAGPALFVQLGATS